ncbi:MAG: hypothetical protein EB127_03755 [Alphaproteobacteria bacterium]|nr:hypothetical protein [Alphaproteobacteria bacterium]
MNKDQKLIAEAYAKIQESLYSRLSREREAMGIDSFKDEGKPGYWTSGYDSKTAKGKISGAEFKAAKDSLRDSFNKLMTTGHSSLINDFVYKLTQFRTFSPEAAQLRIELEDELESIKDDIEFRQKRDTISRLFTDLLNASIWSFGESVEEASSSKLTVESLIKAIETSLQPFRFDCEVCYLGQVMDVLEKMGFKLWGYGPDREQFDSVWEQFVAHNAYCYDMSATDSYDMDEETPRFSENKIEKNGPGEYLFMEGSGRGPDAYLASEFASEHGYKKLILNGLS